MNTPTTNLGAQPRQWIAFDASRRIAVGSPPIVIEKLRSHIEAYPKASIQIFDAVTSDRVEVDLRSSMPPAKGSPAQRKRSNSRDHQEIPAVAAGRPKLGVVAREVTLLPRHWEWLASQPGGSSAALRKLVEHALRSNSEVDRLRRARDATHRFMYAMAGDEPGFEEASRALFADQPEKLRDQIAKWPKDVREHTLSLVESGARA